MLWSIIHSTLGELATGILIFIAFVPPSKIGKGFGRFHSGLALALWLLALRGNFNVVSFILFSFLVLTFLFSWNNLWYYIFLFCSIVCALIDLILYRVLPMITVCYRCRSIYRGFPNSAHEGFNLGINDRYRSMENKQGRV
jgi:hypothetical protein